MTTARANIYGVGALVLWSTIIGLMRSVTEAFGAQAGTALIYTTGAVVLCLKNGIPDVRKIPAVYLLGGGFFFVLYEVAFSQAIALAGTHLQTLEVGMLHY